MQAPSVLLTVPPDEFRPDVQRMWSHYADQRTADQQTPDQRSGTGLRNELWAAYADWPEIVVRRLRRDLPGWVDFEALRAEAQLGLLRAIERYRPRPEVPFRRYAWLRMRGAVLDAMREADFVSRTSRHLQNQARAAGWQLAQQHGRRATDEEVQSALRWPEHQLQQFWRNRAMLRLDDPLPSRGHDEACGPRTLGEVLAAPRPPRPLQRGFESLTQGLDFEDKILLYLRYCKKKSFVEIASVLGYSPSTITNRHRQALERQALRIERDALEDLD